jgi:hypothetical protein
LPRTVEKPQVVSGFVGALFVALACRCFDLLPFFGIGLATKGSCRLGADMGIESDFLVMLVLSGV